jgi:hypothetical protein
VTFATYVTGNAFTATGRGVAVDASGNQYVTGTLTAEDGSTSGYVAEYSYGSDGLPHQQYLMTFQAQSPDGLTFTADNTESHGIAVDGGGNLYVVGTAHSTTSTLPDIHVAYVVKLSNDASTVLAAADPVGLYAAGPSAPNSYDGVALDQAGDVLAVGQYSPNPSETEIAFGFYSADDLSMINCGFYPFQDTTPYKGSAGLGAGIKADGTEAALAGYLVPQDQDPPAHQVGLTLIVDPMDPNASWNYFPFMDPGDGGDARDTAAGYNAAGNAFVASTIAQSGGGTIARVTKYSAQADLLTNPPSALYNYESTDTTTTAAALTVGPDGYIYLTGTAQDASGNTDVLITRLMDTGMLTEDGSDKVGGTGTSAGAAVAVDSVGNVYVVGTTNCSDFPVTDGSTLNSQTTDAFLLTYGF